MEKSIDGKNTFESFINELCKYNKLKSIKASKEHLKKIIEEL